MDQNAQVYLGAWTNWSRGSAVMGATLTLTREQGNLLIAFTALFIPFVASRFWRIFAILFHQCYSTSDPRDTIHNQRQIVLRNSTSLESGLFSFAELMWAWRGASRRAWVRILPVALFVFLSIVAFTVAGGFSSQISMTGEVLLKGNNCRTSYLMHTTNQSVISRYMSYASTFVYNMASYEQQCYTNQSSGLVECDKFVTGTIPTTTMDYNASCPFENQLCRRNHSNIRFDTGHLNSNDMFGLNSPRDTSFTFRHVMQCAPLVTEGRIHNITVSNRNFTTYNYGQQIKGSGQFNYTHIVPDIETQYSTQHLGLTNNINFLLTTREFTTFQGSFDESTSNFVPDSDIITRDGDVSLCFLSGNGVHFSSHTDDDWYRATVSDGDLSRTDYTTGQKVYRPEEAATPLGCILQYQWCRDPSRGQCGNLEGSKDSIYSAAPWFNLTDKDLEPDRSRSDNKLGSLLLWAYYNLLNETPNLAIIIGALGPTSLASQKLVQTGLLSGIQKNQWHLDVTRWWHIVLATFQATFVDTAEGSGLPGTVKPENKYEWDICRNQKIRSAQHSSFSIFGLAFTYGMGALIIFMSFAIPPFLRLLQKRERYSKYAYLEGEGDTSIQLHRVAQDQLGHGNWSRCDETIPTTDLDDLLAPFDISDPKHPMLARSISATAALEENAPESTAQDSSGIQTPYESSLGQDDEVPLTQ
ncbi:hypothetical protein PG999_000276 [Apiospora kogelbergensis]|uniref:Uncharacterized protein n=1 Tax=Apiospora kogelbergensis TaxID=1337665 RepID=A0AAW0RB94_9PEZI